MKGLVVKAAAAILLVGGLFIACIVSLLGPVTDTSIISGKDNNSGSEGTTEPPIVYVTSVDELPMDTVTEFALDFLADRIENTEDDFLFSYTEPKLYGVYFMTLKEGETWGYKNVLKIVVYYEEYMQGEFRQMIYEPLDFCSIEIKPDGTVDLDYEMGRGGTFNTDIDAHMREYEEYNITKIDLLEWID